MYNFNELQNKNYQLIQFNIDDNDITLFYDSEKQEIYRNKFNDPQTFFVSNAKFPLKFTLYKKLNDDVVSYRFCLTKTKFEKLLENKSIVKDTINLNWEDYENSYSVFLINQVITIFRKKDRKVLVCEPINSSKSFVLYNQKTKKTSTFTIRSFYKHFFESKEIAWI